MKQYRLKYGSGYQEFDFSETNVLKVIEPNEVKLSPLSSREIVQQALEHPIASARLRDLVKAGETVCVVIPDTTRAWQSPHLYVPPVIEELNKGGVKDEDILIISATGTHRKQTDDEYKKLVSEDIFKRVKVIDHDCRDTGNLVYLGATTRGTPVWINKKAMDCDHIVLTGGVIYHFLAGFGGGRKYILPGIAGLETILKNHVNSFNEGLGSGSNPNVKSGNMGLSNPVASDMLEVASFVKPTFILNVIVDGDKKITHAFAGNYIKAHEEGAKTVMAIDGVRIKEKAEMVIASACGCPKDINLYQTSKTMFNAVEALQEDGIMIVASECPENFGNPDTEYIMTRFDSLLDMEKDMRKAYTIGKGIGYMECEYARRFHIILVSQMKPENLSKTNMKVVNSITEALELAYQIKGKRDLKTYLMPHGANTMPLLD
jgi:lactate racemase